MTTTVDGTKILRLLKNVLESRGLGDDAAPRIKFDEGSGAGEGFISVNTAVEITAGGKKVKLFVKSAPKEEGVRKELSIRDLFVREIFFYRVLYPEFLRFQAERGASRPFACVPECHAADDEDHDEIVVLEDLKDAGYVPYDTSIEVDEAHLALVFEEFARFHAVSYVMRSREPQLYASLAEAGGNFVLGDCLKAMGLHVLFTHFAGEVTNMFDPVKDERVLNRIRELPGLLLDALDDVGQFSDAHSVFVHGDAWYNNFMFRYQDSRRRVLTDLKLLDWQALHVSSPVLDLSHLIYGIADKVAMSKLDFYMRLYHDALSKNVDEMGGDPDELYPYAAFQDHWRRFSRNGLMNSFGIQRSRFTEPEDLVKIYDVIAKGKTVSDGYLCEIKNERSYMQRMKDVVEHFVENDFI